MHNKFKQLTVAAGIALASLASIQSANSKEMIEGLVIRVHDGDTLTIVDRTMKERKIRLTGIDSPELTQRFGDEARISLDSMTNRKDVRVFYEKVDIYDRILGRVIVGDLDANAQQVKTGMAWAYRSCNKYHLCRPNQDSIPHLGSESDAKNTRTGLWQDPSPEAPWDYRKSKRPQ